MPAAGSGGWPMVPPCIASSRSRTTARKSRSSCSAAPTKLSPSPAIGSIAIRELANIDKVLDWGVIWGERRKAAAAAAATVNGIPSTAMAAAIASIRSSRSCAREPRRVPIAATYFTPSSATIVGCGWTAEQILTHLQQFPQGISERYLREDRLHREIDRSASKYAAAELPLSAGWVDGWEAKAPPQPEPQKCSQVTIPSLRSR